MASRSRIAEFRSIRRSITQYHKRKGSILDYELEGITDDLNPSTRAFGLLLVPAWMSKSLANIQSQLDDIRLNLDKLGDLHNELPSFNVSGSSTHSDIEDFTTVLTSKFTKCSNAIKAFGKNTGQVGESAEKFLSSVRAHRIIMLQALSSEFERMQQQYLQNVMGQMKSSKYFDYKGTDSDSGSDEYLQDYSNKSLQQQMVHHDRKTINERDKQVKQMAKSIAEITSLFTDMADMVNQQGTILDRIDYNITSASENISHAVIELGEADKLEFSSAKCLIIFLIVIILFSGTVILALWSKKRNQT